MMANNLLDESAPGQGPGDALTEEEVIDPLTSGQETVVAIESSTV
jgi:hypothetical protein